jgi:hypothetical protein
MSHIHIEQVRTKGKNPNPQVTKNMNLKLDRSRYSIERISASYVVGWKANASMLNGGPLTPIHAEPIFATLLAAICFQIQEERNIISA